jgi:hypothetical protein
VAAVRVMAATQRQGLGGQANREDALPFGRLVVRTAISVSAYRVYSVTDLRSMTGILWHTIDQQVDPH